MNLAKILALLALAKKYGPAIAELIQHLLEQFKDDPDARVFQASVPQAGCDEAPCPPEPECCLEKALHHLEMAAEYGEYKAEHIDKVKSCIVRHLAKE
jgi:hypothetical protein